jgi:hypothetical protein
VLEYGAIPYRVTHPGKKCGLVSVQTSQFSPAEDQIACQGTALYRKARAASVPVRDLNEAPAFVTLFTSMFMHGGWLHIAFNMLFFWIFGNNIEDSMGRIRFVLFYLLGGLAAVLAQVAVDVRERVVDLRRAHGAPHGLLLCAHAKNLLQELCGMMNLVQVSAHVKPHAASRLRDAG